MNERREESIITSYEKALIMGSLLGDAHIQKRNGSYRLKIEHGSKQKSYVLWKHSKLAFFCQTTKEPVERISTKGYGTFQFYTRSGKWLSTIYHLFYKQDANGRYVKTITPELIKALPIDPVLLAVFFMDDGSVRNDCYSGKLATQGFSLEQQHLLASYLKNYGINCNVVAHSKSKKQYYLSIPAKSFHNLISHIEPVVNEIPEMVYKLNISCKPRND